jgi:hypothetical protein
MKKRIVTAMSLLAFLFALGGCNVVWNTFVAVRNSSTMTIYAIQVSETTSSNWGDQLNNNPIQPGGLWNMAIPAGFYDILLSAAPSPDPLSYFPRLNVEVAQDTTYTWDFLGTEETVP